VLSPETLGRTLGEAPDPQLARVALSRIGDDPRARALLADETLLRTAVPLLGLSTAAADLLVAHPEEVAALADVRRRSAEELARELGADAGAHGDADGLRRFRRRAMLRVAAADLAGRALEDVVAEISDVAGACVRFAWARTSDERTAVIALGKLGGHELNYASDVDLLFLHADDIDRDRAERGAAAFIALLAEPTAEGLALRVDPALRPGGRAGSLSRTVGAMREYYASAAATWERQALIKAAPVAGDPELGAAFVAAVTPFVYPEELPAATIDEVRRVKVRLEEYVRALGKAGTEVKRGRGGIRDVEFAVQLLQIVHGRRDERLRDPSTLGALRALAAEGYVAGPDADALADAYRFLRTLEHRLQVVRDLQTHELPADRDARTRIARSLGLEGADALQAEYERRTALVRGLHERLFYRPLLEAFAGPAGPRPGVDRASTEELLRGLGFQAPSSAFDVLATVVSSRTRLGKVLANVWPVVAPAFALAADPDAALVRLSRVTAAIGDDEPTADAVAADPRIARRLASAVAVSSFATDLLVASPARVPALVPSRETGRDEGVDGGEGGDAAAALVRVVAAYAARELDPRSTGDRIGEVADRVVREAVERVAPRVPLAVIGLGKLGARELNFASDLDVVFVYEGDDAGSFEAATAAAERILAEIRRAGWEPDADLRPEGRAGPLARSFAAWLEYWERYADTWEFQSLLRARFVAGDASLGTRFCSFASDFAFPDVLTVDRVAEVRRMRDRVERERVRPAEAARFHFKLGYGSLADVQFAVELSLMRHGGAHPTVRTTRTLEAIEALARERLIEDTVARELGEAFVFLSDVKNALEIDRRVHAEALPAAPEELTVLARRLGFEEYPVQTLFETYRRVTRRARRAMERVFFDAVEDA
jgi:[glutamine synthetase] adenylyltransferase / [glutamine synthetase]-adenylyl-L-tyrosine phosphorylase